jgi:uncharacterized protein YceK
MDRRILVVALVALLAGCGAVMGTDEGEDAVTPAPVATPEPDRNAGPQLLAPGLSTAGIDNPNALILRHIAVVTNASFVWTEKYRERGVSEPASYRQAITRTVAYESRGSGYRFWTQGRSVVSGQRRYVDRREQFGTQAGGYVRGRHDGQNGTRVRRLNRSVERADFALPNRPVRHLLVLENQTVERAEVGDRPHFEIRGTRDAIPDHGSVDEFESRVVVREDGLIRVIEVSFVTHIYGEPTPIEYQLTFTEVGKVTVEEPDWVSQVRDRAGED